MGAVQVKVAGQGSVAGSDRSWGQCLTLCRPVKKSCVMIEFRVLRLKVMEISTGWPGQLGFKQNLIKPFNAIIDILSTILVAE